jgi:thymidylate synthase
MFNGTTYYGERGYIQLMRDILNKGVDVSDRTGVGTRALFDAKVIYAPGDHALATIRSCPLRLAFEEFWFFLSGQTQTKALEAKGVKFWVGNTTREFLDKRGLHDLDEGDMGWAYGHNYRHFNKGAAISEEFVCDQITETYNALKKDRYTRRAYVTIWHPGYSHKMALTPCWLAHQAVILPDENGDDTLHFKLSSRSLDALYGFQYAASQFRLYQLCLAKLLGVKLGYLSCDLSQTHIYHNALEYSQEVVGRDFGTPGVVSIKKPLNTLKDLLELQWEDIQVSGHIVNTAPFNTPKPPMAA